MLTGTDQDMSSRNSSDRHELTLSGKHSAAFGDEDSHPKRADAKVCPHLFYETAISTNLLVAEPQVIYEMNPQQWVEVLVDSPGATQMSVGLYTYSLPAELQVQSGDIVSVPFGMQLIGGIVIRLVTSPPVDLDPARIRPIEDVITSGFLKIPIGIC